MLVTFAKRNIGSGQFIWPVSRRLALRIIFEAGAVA